MNEPKELDAGTRIKLEPMVLSRFCIVCAARRKLTLNQPHLVVWFLLMSARLIQPAGLLGCINGSFIWSLAVIKKSSATGS